MSSESLDAIKQSIWHHRKIHRNKVNLQVEADRHGIPLPISSTEVAQRFLDLLCKRKIKKKVETPKRVIDRYNAAHKAYNEQEFPNWCKDSHYMDPVWPDVGSSNGLTSFIMDYLKWVGARATRISVEGRVIKGGTRIQSSTRKGSADVSSTISGRSVQWEVKVGNDKPRAEQLKEQILERKAGGEYFFTHSPEEFYGQLDGICKQSSIFESTNNPLS